MKWLILVAVLIAVSAVFFILNRYAGDFFRIDDCLDRGGCWDYEARMCRKEEPNAQALCDAPKG